MINFWIALSSLWTWAEKELKIPHALRGITRPHEKPPAVEPFTRAGLVFRLPERVRPSIGRACRRRRQERLKSL